MSSDKLNKYLADWDPMGFVADGAPKDEYDREAREIYLAFDKTMTDEQVAELTYKIFVDSFELDPDDFKGQCYKRAPEIRVTLAQN